MDLFRNLRKEYSINAVGFVQCKVEDNGKYRVVFAKVTPETSIRNDPYTVEMHATHDDIIFARCYGCVAQNGDFKNFIGYSQHLMNNKVGEPTRNDKFQLVIIIKLSHKLHK
jgi:hypothetical protein